MRLVSIFACTLAIPGSAQTWEPVTEPTMWTPPALAYDAANGRVVQLGGIGVVNVPFNDTREWDGQTWRLRRPANTPPTGGSLAFDRARRVTVLFDTSNDTWEWDGVDWTKVSPGVPSTVASAQIAWDPQQQRVLLLGTNGPASETWHWDGAQWTQLNPPTSPPPRSDFALAESIRRGTVVLFGGRDGSNDLRDTWEWNGSTWIQRTPGTSPPALVSPRMAYDAVGSRNVLVGRSSLRAPTWQWDEAGWTRVTLTQELPYDVHDLAFDAARGEMVARGSIHTWKWDTTSAVGWSRIANPQPMQAWQFAEMVFDTGRDRAVLFTGETRSAVRTWEWDPTSEEWTERTPVATPPPRDNTALAFDARRGRTVMFGGSAFDPSGFRYLNDTWEWDGTSWHPTNPTNTPPERAHHAMAYDPIRGVTVLFSGSGNGILSDTWEWDGTDWTDVTPATSPPPRAYHRMAFDPATGRVMMFSVPRGPLFVTPDVWEFDGATWTQRAPAQGPYPTGMAGLMSDPSGRVLLLSATVVVPNVTNDLWEWDGAHGTWFAHTLASPVPAAASAVFDPARGQVIAAGSNGTWSWGTPRALATPFGMGCAGIAGRPALTANGRPLLGNAAFDIRVAPVQPGWIAFFVLSATAAVNELPGGCRWYLGPTIAAIPVATTASGDATLPLPVPNAAVLIGIDPFFQVLVGDPAGQLLGSVAASDAMRVRFGL